MSEGCRNGDPVGTQLRGTKVGDLAVACEHQAHRRNGGIATNGVRELQLQLSGCEAHHFTGRRTGRRNGVVACRTGNATRERKNAQDGNKEGGKTTHEFKKR